MSRQRDSRALLLSGVDLSRRVGVHRILLWKTEHGRIDAWPRFRRAAATALGVDEALIFGDPTR